MGKFKVGDRFTVNWDDLCGGYKAGDEFEVIGFDGGVTFIDNDGDKRYLGVGHISLVPVAEATGMDAGGTQADKPKFKVGDRVRVTDAKLLRRGTPIGAMGTITEIEGKYVYFELEHPECGKIMQMLCDPEEFLELVPVAEATGTVKIGDKVVVLDNLTRSGSPIKEYPIGATLTVDRTCGDGYGNEAYLFNGHHQYLRRDQIEPFTQNTLTIQSGKFYLTRDGRKVGPARQNWGDSDYPWWVGESTYTDSGAWHTGGYVEDNDLVAEADEPPAEPQSTKEILDELEAWIAEQDAIKAAGNASTAGFTVPLCAYDDEPGWYAAELGRAYADGYAAGLRAAA